MPNLSFDYKSKEGVVKRFHQSRACREELAFSWFCHLHNLDLKPEFRQHVVLHFRGRITPKPFTLQAVSDVLLHLNLILSPLEPLRGGGFKVKVKLRNVDGFLIHTLAALVKSVYIQGAGPIQALLIWEHEIREHYRKTPLIRMRFSFQYDLNFPRRRWINV